MKPEGCWEPWFSFIPFQILPGSLAFGLKFRKALTQGLGLGLTLIVFLVLVKTSRLCKFVSQDFTLCKIAIYECRGLGIFFLALSDFQQVFTDVAVAPKRLKTNEKNIIFPCFLKLCKIFVHWVHWAMIFVSFLFWTVLIEKILIFLERERWEQLYNIFLCPKYKTRTWIRG